jgi:hypothetical protein
MPKNLPTPDQVVEEDGLPGEVEARAGLVEEEE